MSVIEEEREPMKPEKSTRHTTYQKHQTLAQPRSTKFGFKGATGKPNATSERTLPKLAANTSMDAPFDLASDVTDLKKAVAPSRKTITAPSPVFEEKARFGFGKARLGRKQTYQAQEAAQLQDSPEVKTLTM